jgi:pimeloyl-ACP methyl ester carboxylesterase
VPVTPFDDHGSLIRWTEVPGRLPARVFVHGLGSNGLAIYGEVITDPAISGHRTIVLDLPGHGASDRPADFPYTLDAHAAAVAAVGITPMTRELFTGLRMPRTFMFGDHGEPLLGASELRTAGVRIVEIPAAGHMVMFDNRPAYVAALAAALAAGESPA